MSNSIKQHYQNLLKQYGANHNAVQHVSEYSQQARFEIFWQLLGPTDSIIDLGCGLADMLPFFRAKGFTGRYLGLDLVPEFIEIAQTRFKDDKHAEFQCFDVVTDFLPTDYDHVLISGIFNNKFDDNLHFLTYTITQAFTAAKMSVMFNALSDYVEYQDSDLHYYSPLTLFDTFKRQLTPFITLKHDYVTKENGFPYEFTMILRKEAKPCN